MSVRPGRGVEGCLRTGHGSTALDGAEGTVTEGVVVPRPPGTVGLREEYGLLRGRVLGKPGRHDAAPAVGGGR
ncbi:hypothetical protein ACIA6T_04335 [Streptomyces sp. NPDC051740]|uniref:hypothetical protein n=1 Tax=Streptomyces sp. NPDC051740 TaxID=3365673 RepID=UPI003787DC68